MANHDITKVDRNLAPTEVKWDGMKSWDVNQPPFKLYGACRAEGETDFKRLPHDVAARINDGVKRLYTNTAGIRLRFKTDSKKIIIRATWDVFTVFDHMPRTGVSCFDLYADGRYVNVLRPGVVSEGEFRISPDKGYESSYTFPDKKMRDLTLNFPLYNDVTSLVIALDEDAQVLPGDEYAHTTPIVYLGSSITQGGCASHPGNSYQAIISRRLDTDYINLGFSGSCRAEVEMAEYIAGLKMSMFVYDYDHNAPNPEHLEKTHERLFKILREKQPDLPVLMISTADQCFRENTDVRKAIIRRTWENAVAAGDKNVYFLDGQTIYQDVGLDYCTVDGTHPNDLGFWCMANAIGAEIQKIMEW